MEGLEEYDDEPRQGPFRASLLSVVGALDEEQVSYHQRSNRIVRVKDTGECGLAVRKVVRESWRLIRREGSKLPKVHKNEDVY